MPDKIKTDKGIPAIPMIKQLVRYAREKNLPFNCRRWDDIIRCFNYYSIHTALLN